jgi:Lipopolysaccharide-assembly
VKKPVLRRLISSAAALAMAALAAATVAGCGYHFAASGSNLPSDAKTIYVARFANRTRQTGLNDVFMRYIKDEIAMHHRLRLVDSPADADLELNGEIMAQLIMPGSFNSVLEPTIYNQSLNVTATLKDLRTNKVIWKGNHLGNLQHSPVVAQAVVPTTPEFVQGNLRSSDIANMTDIQVAQTQMAAGQDQVMQNVARNLYASMSEGF